MKPIIIGPALLLTLAIAACDEDDAGEALRGAETGETRIEQVQEPVDEKALREALRASQEAIASATQEAKLATGEALVAAMRRIDEAVEDCLAAAGALGESKSICIYE